MKKSTNTWTNLVGVGFLTRTEIEPEGDPLQTISNFTELKRTGIFLIGREKCGSRLLKLSVFASFTVLNL